MFCRVILCIFIFIVLTSCQVLPPQADYDVVTNYGPQDCRKINLYYEKQRDKNSYFPGCVPKKGKSCINLNEFYFYSIFLKNWMRPVELEK